MYDRLNEVFVRRPDLHLGLMLLLGFGPWLVTFMLLVMAAAYSWFLLVCLSLPAFVFAMHAWLPMPAKSDAYQRRTERNYRLIRLLGGVLMCVAAPLVVWRWPDLGVRPAQFALLGSLIGLWAAGHHVRFRWVKPEAEPAAS